MKKAIIEYINLLVALDIKESLESIVRILGEHGYVLLYNEVGEVVNIKKSPLEI